MTSLVIAIPLALFAALMLWRIHVERGRVTMTAFEVFAARVVLMERAMGEQLLPALQRANAAMVAFNEAWRRGEDA